MVYFIIKFRLDIIHGIFMVYFLSQCIAVYFTLDILHVLFPMQQIIVYLNGSSDDIDDLADLEVVLWEVLLALLL